MSRYAKLASLLVAFALIAAACGDSSGESEEVAPAATQAEAPATTAAPQTTQAPATTAAATTTAAPTTTIAPATTTTAAPTTTTTAAPPTPEAIAADFNIPIRENTDLTSGELIGDGAELSMIVNSAPPPNYATDLAAAGWEVLDVQFGSEFTIGWDEAFRQCIYVFANYESPAVAWFWMWAIVLGSATPEECLAAADQWHDELDSRGVPES